MFAVGGVWVLALDERRHQSIYLPDTHYSRFYYKGLQLPHQHGLRYVDVLICPDLSKCRDKEHVKITNSLSAQGTRQTRLGVAVRLK